MPATYFWVGSAQGRHKEKGVGVNADFMCLDARYLAVFDGVSGVADRGMRPEDMSRGLRDAVAKILHERTYDTWLWSTDFDNDLASNMNLANSAARLPGQWLRDVMARAYYMTDKLGSTTGVVCSMSYNTLTWYVCGDSKLIVLRPSSTTLGARTILETPTLEYTIDDPVDPNHGRLCPYQLTKYDNNTSKETSVSVVAQGRFNTVTVESGDVVLLMSDGIWDNLGESGLERIALPLYHNWQTPDAIASAILEECLRPGVVIKDDCTVIVAFVCHQKRSR